MFTSYLTNQTQTDNGAKAFKSTESSVLDLFSSGVSSQDKTTLIQHALEEDLILATKVALYLRDVRNGQGNRDILRALMSTLNRQQATKLMKTIVKHLPEIGRWKDVIELLSIDNPKLQNYVLKRIHKGLDAEDALLAKWLPRQGSTAKLIAKYLGFDHGDYRRKIVALSRTVEQQMCAREWSAINYSSVPSIANKKYANAFLRNDEERRRAFLEAATKGDVKINSSVLYPHQITGMIKRTWHNLADSSTADALWKQLPSYMENASNVLPIIDVSGSMHAKAIGTEGSCLDVALGLGLYFAEHNTGSYKDLWMSFSSNPTAYYLKGDTLSERIRNMDYRSRGMSTDIDKAFDFILSAAKAAPEEAPKMILIVSDMEFNGCVRQSNYEYYQQEFSKLGIEIPKVVFWRVNVSSGSTPITKNDTGAIIINGYSPSILQYILSGQISDFNPYQAMLDIVQPMYTFLDNKEY